MSTPTHLDRYRPRRRQLAAWGEQEPDLAGLGYDELRAGQVDRAVAPEVQTSR
jgi:hypothetical protein